MTAPGDVRWKLGPDDTTRWGDGPLARAVGQPGKFAIIGGRVVFADAARDALRVMTDARVMTLAGSRPGRHDGAGADARFFEIAAVGAWPLGGVVVVEATPTAITRRIVEVTE